MGDLIEYPAPTLDAGPVERELAERESGETASALAGAASSGATRGQAPHPGDHDALRTYFEKGEGASPELAERMARNVLDNPGGPYDGLVRRIRQARESGQLVRGAAGKVSGAADTIGDAFHIATGTPRGTREQRDAAQLEDTFTSIARGEDARRERDDIADRQAQGYRPLKQVVAEQSSSPWDDYMHQRDEQLLAAHQQRRQALRSVQPVGQVVDHPDAGQVRQQVLRGLQRGDGTQRPVARQQPQLNPLAATALMMPAASAAVRSVPALHPRVAAEYMKFAQSGQQLGSDATLDAAQAKQQIAGESTDASHSSE